MEPGPTADPALSYPSPTDLRFSELGSREVKLHWTNPAKPVQQYRVVYHSAEGQSPEEVRTQPYRYITTLGLRHKHSYISNVRPSPGTIPAASTLCFTSSCFVSRWCWPAQSPLCCWKASPLRLSTTCPSSLCMNTASAWHSEERSPHVRTTAYC